MKLKKEISLTSFLQKVKDCRGEVTFQTEEGGQPEPEIRSYRLYLRRSDDESGGIGGGVDHLRRKRRL